MKNQSLSSSSRTYLYFECDSISIVSNKFIIVDNILVRYYVIERVICIVAKCT